MNILITGASGFIGTNFIRSMSRQYNIFGVSRNRSTAFPDSAVQYIQADLSANDLSTYLPDKIDCVIHLAQSNMHRHFPSGANDMFAVNIKSTANILEWARTSGVSHFILASTASVYSAGVVPYHEGSRVNADSFYAATKIAAEQLSAQYTDYFTLDILRLFTVYGPGQSDMLVPRICSRLIEGSVIKLARGKGLYLSPIFIDDAVICIHKIIAQRSSSISTPLRFINICGNQVLSLSDIVRIIAQYTNCVPNIVHTADEIRSITGSNTLLKSIVGGFVFTDFAEGVKKVVEAYVTVRQRLSTDYQ
jgi:UDP-glucose 4-epimerase